MHQQDRSIKIHYIHIPSDCFESLPSLTGDETRLKPIKGMMPDPANLPEGCYFHPRCPYADEQCGTCKPELTDAGDGHLVRCHKLKKAGGR